MATTVKMKVILKNAAHKPSANHSTLADILCLIFLPCVNIGATSSGEEVSVVHLILNPVPPV